MTAAIPIKTTIETQLLGMSQAEAVRFWDSTLRPLTVRRVTDRIWHIEHDGQPIHAGSYVRIAQCIREL
jgi:hypothetical protein